MGNSPDKPSGPRFVYQSRSKGSKPSSGLTLSQMTSWPGSVVLITIGSVLIISRSIQAVFHPYFWAESGAIFYADAWNHGISALLSPFAGYPVLLPRLASELAVQFPLTIGPFIFMIVSLIVQMIPLALIFSPRFANKTVSPITKIALAAIYVALPNSYEVNMHMISAQWQLAVIAFLILISAPPTKKSQRLFDVIGLLLAGLTGPFATLLFPVAVIFYWQKHSSKYNLRLLIITACAAIDGFAYIITHAYSRSGNAPLGISFGLLTRILGGQIVLGALTGMRGYTQILQHRWADPLSIAAGIFYLIFTIFVLFRGKFEVRLFQLFALLVLAASLTTPKISLNSPQWPLLLQPGNGNRYFYLPLLAFLVSSMWLVCYSYSQLRRRRRPKPTQSKRLRYKVVFITLAVQLAILAVVGIPKDWAFPTYRVPNLATYQAALISKSGGEVTIPIVPSGISMVLNRR